MAEVSPGTMLGGYRVERKLGEGGMGAVYSVVHPVIGKRAAAKVIHEAAIRAPHATERFIQEARLVNAIRHPNLVDVFGFATFEDGRPVLIMELLDGETLRDLLSRGRVPVAETVRLLRQVLGGLGAAHRAGVIHRDLKPDNLFVVHEASGPPSAKILDFGIAKLVDLPADRKAPVTGEHYTVGTPEYMSPEQCRGGDLDGRADLYALGLILFEMLVGGRPFVAESGGEYVGQHLYVAPPSMRDVAPHVGERLADLVAALLSKDPADRPPTAEAVSDELEAIVSDPKASSMTRGPTLAAGELPTPPSAVVSAPTVGVTPISAPTEQNRLCTVLCVELLGVGGGEAEELSRAMEVCLRAVTERVEKHGGRVDRVTADGLMAAFGVPRSTDNDAERAVLAALEIPAVAQRALQRASGETPTLGVLVGVETGVVFTGYLGGGASRRDLTIVGEPVTVASSLCSSAEAGMILVGRGTHRHTAGLFSFEEAARVRVRGAAEAVDCWRVTGRARGSTSLEPPRFYGETPPFIGRKADLNRLLDAMEQCFEEERAQLLTVVGAPGVGKSRLMMELQRRAAEGDDFVFTVAARASAQSHDGVYDLVSSLVRSRFRIHQDDPREVVETKLRAGIRWLAGFAPPRLSALPPDPNAAAGRTTLPEADPADAADAIEVLLELLRSSVGDEPAISEEVASPASSRVAAAVAKLIGLVAMKAPVLVVCDSLELADDGSLGVLDYLVTRLPEARLLIVGFARPRLWERRPHWGEGSRAHGRWELAPLSRRRMTDLARALLARAPGATHAFVGRLVQRADGNPLVLEETVRALVDAKVVEQDNGAWRIHESRLETVELPPTVYGLVQARLDRLPDDQRALLMRAAVVGSTFWRGALEALPYDEARGTTVPEWIARSLEELRSRDLVRARETSQLPDEREYVFADAVTAEVAYRALSKKDRQQLHQGVAAWLERFGTVLVNANPALLAFHHDRGGNAPAALGYYLRAARRAAAVGQNEAALVHLDRAVALGSTGPVAGDTEPSVDRRVATWNERVALHVERGDTLRRVGRLKEARSAYESARRALDDTDRIDPGATGPPVGALDALIDFRLGLVEKARGAHDDALDHYDTALVMLDRRKPSSLQVEILIEAGFAHSRTGDFAEALESCRRGLEICQKLSSVDRRDDLVARLLYTMGVSYYHQNELVRAERFYRQGARLARRCDDAHLESVGLNNLAAVAFERGDYAAARDSFLGSLALKERLGDLFDLVIAYNNLAEVSLKLGNASAALDQSKRALDLARVLGEGAELADVHRNAAEASVANGRHSDALEHARRACELACQPSGRVYLGACTTTLVGCLGRARREGGDEEPLRAVLDETRAWAKSTLAGALESASLDEALAELRRVAG